MDAALVSVSGAGHTASNPSQINHLERIPLELRRMIYHCVLDTTDRDVACDWPEPSPNMRVTKSNQANNFSNLMLTCRQIYAECKDLGRSLRAPLVSISLHYWITEDDLDFLGMLNWRGEERWYQSMENIPSLFTTTQLSRLHIDFYDGPTLNEGFEDFVYLFGFGRTLTELSITFQARINDREEAEKFFYAMNQAKESWKLLVCSCRDEVDLQMPEGPFDMHGWDLNSKLSEIRAVEDRRWKRVNRKFSGSDRIHGEDDDGDDSSDDDDDDSSHGGDDFSDDGGFDVVLDEHATGASSAWMRGAWIK